MTPPVGYADDGVGMAVVLLVLLLIASAHAYDLPRRLAQRRPRPRPKRRRWLQWDDQKNIRNWQQRRATTGIAAVEAWLTKQNIGDTK